jgi:hypothetical protein
MRLGLAKKKCSTLKTVAYLAAGAAVLLALGCEEAQEAVMMDAFNAFLDTAIPGMLQLWQENMADDGGSTPTGGGGGGLPTVMREAAQTARLLLA